MKSRILALLMILTIAFQIIPIMAVSAEVSNDSADKEVVRLLEALNIMGTDSYTDMFWDDKPVKRREIAEILCNLLKLEAVSETKPIFADVSEDDRPYIETIVSRGYMSGYGDTQFGPDEYVTGEQLVKIFVSLLGADKLAEESGGFPSGYIYIAKRIGLLNGSLGDLSRNASRIDVANIIYSAMDTDMVVLSGISGGEEIYDSSKGETFLTETLDIYRINGIVYQTEVTSTNTADGAGDSMVRIGNALYEDSKYYADDYLGSRVTAYIYRPDLNDYGEIIYITEDKNNKSVCLDENDIINVSGRSVSYYVGDKKKTLKFSPVADMVYNGKAIIFDETRLNLRYGSARFTDNDNDGNYDIAVITEYSTYIADRINIEEKTITVKYGAGTISLYSNFYRIYRDGEAAELADIGIGDVLIVAESEGDGYSKMIEIRACSKAVMGVANSIYMDSDGKRRVVVSGTEYTLGSYCETLIANNKISDIVPGSGGQFFLDSKGTVVYTSISAGEMSVGYLIESRFNDDVFSTKLSVKLYTLDKVIAVYEAKDKITVDDIKYDVADLRMNAIYAQQLNKAQVVKYKEKDGVLEELDFAEEGYKENEFSRCASGSFKCSRTSVLDEKYYTPADTIVFYVPSTDTDEVGHYNIYNGTTFTRINGNYSNVNLYDADECGKIAYASRTWYPRGVNINGNTAVLVISEIYEGVDSDGSIVNVIKGFNESGGENELKADSSLIVYKTGDSTDGTVKVDVGDVIQYRCYYNTDLIESVNILHDASDPGEYYLPSAMLTSGTAVAVRLYGMVIRSEGSLALLSANAAATESMVLTDASAMVVSNTGKAVYKYNSEKNILEKMEFSELEYGDKAFACVRENNNTRMFVIYE